MFRDPGDDDPNDTRTLSARSVRRMWFGGLLLMTCAVMSGTVGTGITVRRDLTS
jgi:hypothetical protein